MNLIGCKFSHTAWGIGIVEQHSNSTLDIRFPKLHDDNNLKKFIFPDAIQQGFISAADATTITLVNKAMNERVCSVCGANNVLTEEIDNNRFCSSCQRTYTINCAGCKQIHTTKSTIFAVDDIMRKHGSFSAHTKIPLCSNCADANSFICKKCNQHHTLKHLVSDKYSNFKYCLSCYEEISRKCFICGSSFDHTLGKTIRNQGEIIHICPSCIKEHTFTCSKCNMNRLITSRVDNAYIQAAENVCTNCTTQCYACNEKILTNDQYYSFGHYYCPHCWDTQLTECSICGDSFIPNETHNRLCPDCINMASYVSKLKTVNYLNDAYKPISYYSLDYLDRCSLFTKLYNNTIFRKYNILPEDDTNLYYYLVLDLGPMKIVVMYLQDSITKNLRYSNNLTMTQFKQSKGRLAVIDTINNWLESSTEFIETSSGRMKVLPYPILLRVQTESDKQYGKRWDGPYSYIEICNYGDTTEFWIVGILDESI